MNVLLTDFSGAYAAEGFLQWLQEQAGAVLQYVDARQTEGTCCYCDEAAEAEIVSLLPERIPVLRWIDSGDYHYMSHLLALRETEPFHLVLLDHHPDNQEAAFGGMLSCGSWVRAMQEGNPLLRSVLTIGPEGCPESIPAGWLEERRGERLYLSLDKDLMGTCWARTDWSQGEYSLEQVKGMVGQLLDGGMDVAAIDICGELSESKGALPDDFRINLKTNIELYKYLTKYL